jgi:Glycosyl transferase family 2
VSLWLPERPVDVPPGSGTVAVCAGETARYSAFAASLVELELPAGWSVRSYLGSDIVRNRNRAVRELATEWLLWLDDDHTFQPDLISRLLAHGKDIAGVQHADRSLPCVEPVAGPPGLYEVDVVGCPGCLIHRRVFERLGCDPYRYEPDEDYWLCRDAREAGFSVWRDTSLTPTHITPAFLTPEYAEGRWWLRLRVGGSDWRLEAISPGQEEA